MSAGIGPFHRHAFRGERPDHRFDHVDLLAPEMPRLAAVGIEAGHENPRLRDTELVGQPGAEHPECRGEARASNGFGYVGKRKMGGGQGHAQTAAHQHHHHMLGARALGEVLGVPREGNARVIDCAFVHRSRNHCIELAGEAPVDGAIESGKHVRAIGRIEMSGTRRVSKRHMIYLQGIGQWHSGGDIAAERSGPAQGTAARGQHILIADNHDPSRKISAREHQCKVRPDSGRLAAGDGNNRQTRAHGLLVL